MTSRKPPPPTLSNYRPSHDQPGPGGGPRQGYPAQPPGPAMRVRRRPSGPPRRQSSFGLGSILIYGLIGVVAILGAGLAFLMIAPPTDLIRSQLVSAVKSNTGRDLAIGGPTSFTFYPAIGVTMSKVSLSAPPGMSAPPTVKMDRLLVSVKLLPLLSQQVAINQLILTKPVFDLRVDARGRKSWDFANAATARPIRVAQAQTGRSNDAGDLPPEAIDFLKNSTDKTTEPRPARPQSRGGGTSAAALKELTLDDVRIVNGTIVYTDEAAKSREEVRPLNVKLSLTSLSNPLAASGDIGWKGERVGFEAKLSTPKAILSEQPAKLVAKIDARPVNAQYDGLIDLAGGLQLDGALAARSQSVRALAGWLGTDLPPSRGFGALNLTGRLKAEGATFSFLNANAELDGTKTSGDVIVRTAGGRPHINATLQLSQLDLNKYLAEASVGSAPAPDSGGASDGPVPGTRVQGYTERAGWSDEKIDFSGLGAVDANAKLTVGSLLYKKIKVGQSVIKVALKNRKMRADLTDMTLYEGRGRGVVTLDATSKAAGLGANFAINDVSAQPLLRDASEIEWLAGRGKLTLAIASRGQTERQMVETLTGNASFNFADGAIIGLNIPQMIRGFSVGQDAQAAGSNSQKTDFSELSATFKIQQGVAQNDDLLMLSPLLRLTGNGQIRLPPRQVDYMLRPKIVSSLEGQGGEAGLGGVEIPVRVTGTFDNVKYTPDLGGVLQDPNQAVDVIKQIGDKFKGKKAGEIIDDLFGGGNSSPSADGEAAPEGGQKKKIDAKKLLEGLFGNQ